MDDVTGVFKKPFDAQVAFFRNKLQELRPTQSSSVPEYQKAAHDKAFMVAGAQCADLLSDFAAAVDKAIAQGTSLKDFQKDFDGIVSRHGWEHNGSRDWRSKVIYTTNLSTSYAAARLAQITEDGFSYMTYKHSPAVENPRLAHVALDGTTLPIDHVFWNTHYPPNGWGCQCRVVGVNKPSDAQRYTDEPKYTAPKLSVDPNTGLPEGVSKGWDYKPGATVVDDIRTAITQKAASWPRDISVAYMHNLPPSSKDKFGVSYRKLKTVEDDVQKIFEEAISKPKQKRSITLGTIPSQDVKKISEMEFIETDEALALRVKAVQKHNEGVRRRAEQGMSKPKDKLLPDPVRYDVRDVDLSEYDFEFASDDVRHINSRHGLAKGEKGEQVNSQTPVSPENVKKVLWVLNKPDELLKGVISTKGDPVVVYKRREGKLNYVLHMKVFSGKRTRSLRVLTFRIEGKND